MNGFRSFFTRVTSLFILAVFTFPASAQKILKVQLTDSVIDYLHNQAREYNSPQWALTLNFTTTDMDTLIYKTVEPSVPSSPEEIKKLKKKLCRCQKDIETYTAIGSMYNRLFVPDSGMMNLRRALELCQKEMKLYPDSFPLRQAEAFIFMQMGDYQTAKEKYENILKVRPGDSLAPMLLPVIFIGLGDTAGMITFTRERAMREPEDFISVFFNLYGQGMAFIYRGFSTQDSTRYIKTHPSEVLDFSLLDAIRKRRPQYDYYYETMKYYSYLFVYYGKVVSQAGAKNFMRNFPRTDTTGLGELEAFFKRLLQRKNYKNQYSAYKALGAIYFLQHRYKDAILVLQKAIAAFPEKQKNFNYNPAGEYDNLAAAYGMFGDTVAAEKVLLQKILKKPAVDPLVSDYANLSSYALYRNDLTASKKFCLDGLKIDPRNTGCIKGLAVLSILGKDYKEALKHLELAYSIDKEDPDIYMLTGLAYMLSGSTDTAYSIFKRVLEVYPDNGLAKELAENYFF